MKGIYMFKKLKEFQKKIEPLKAVYKGEECTLTIMSDEYHIVKEIRVNNVKIDVPEETGVIKLNNISCTDNVDIDVELPVRNRWIRIIYILGLTSDILLIGISIWWVAVNFHRIEFSDELKIYIMSLYVISLIPSIAFITPFDFLHESIGYRIVKVLGIKEKRHLKIFRVFYIHILGRLIKAALFTIAFIFAFVIAAKGDMFFLNG